MPIMSSHKKNTYAGILILLCVLVGLGIHAKYYYPFIADDALISLRYADRLLDGKGLTWSDGRPVEGYSNLLWILLIALLGQSGMDLIAASRVLGLASMGIVMFSLLLWYLRKKRDQQSYLPILLGLFSFFMAAPIAAWSIGGLEQPLLAALISIFIPLTIYIIESEVPQKSIILALSLVLGLICITRPDGPLMCIAALAAIYIGRLASRKGFFSIIHTALLASLPIAFYGGQLIFRLAYYGEIVPNTAYVKISPSNYHIEQGVEYLAHGMWALFPFSLLALIFLCASMFSANRRSTGLPLLMIGLLWVPYLVFIGGDIFPAYRHFIPLIVVFAFAVTEGADWMLSRLNRPVLKTIFAGGLLIACGWYSYGQFTDKHNKEAIEERWEWDGKAIGLVLKQEFSDEQPLIAVTAAGCLPYFSELPSLDMLGLNDYYLPRNRPKNFGNGLLGHELGDGQYILRSKPDIIIFHTGLEKPVFRSARQMASTQEFNELYTPVKILGTDPYNFVGMLWFYKYSPKIGIEKASNEIKVPGYLLNNSPDTISYLNAAGKLVVAVSVNSSASVHIDSISSASWDVQVISSGGEPTLNKVELTDMTLVVTIFSDQDQPVEIEEIILTSAN